MIISFLVLFILTICGYSFAKDVFPYGWDGLGGTQTKKKNNICIGPVGLAFSGGLPIEYEGLYISENISFTIHLMPVLRANYNITSTKTKTYGIGGGAGIRYHFKPTLDGLFVGGACSILYAESRTTDSGTFEIKYKSFFIIPYGECGYRINFWDILSIQSAAQLGVYLLSLNTSYDNSVQPETSAFFPYFYFAFTFGVGVTF